MVIKTFSSIAKIYVRGEEGRWILLSQSLYHQQESPQVMSQTLPQYRLSPLSECPEEEACCLLINRTHHMNRSLLVSRESLQQYHWEIHEAD